MPRVDFDKRPSAHFQDAGDGQTSEGEDAQKILNQVPFLVRSALTASVECLGMGGSDARMFPRSVTYSCRSASTITRRGASGTWIQIHIRSHMELS